MSICMEVFWNSIADYNLATWYFQLVFIVLAVLFALLLYFKPSARVKVAAKVFLMAQSLWIAFVYYLKFGGIREHSGVMTIFWCLVSAAWVYDLVTGYSTFQRSGRYCWLGITMIVMSFAYPAVSLARGLSFPYITTPMIPSAVALYMLGLLMTFNRKINFFAFIFIVHWSIIAISKIVFLSIPEDVLLALACIPSLYIFFKGAIESGGSASKPSPAVVKGLVMAIAVAICICMVVELCLN